MSQSTPRVLLIKVPSYSDVVSPPLGVGYLAQAIRDVAHVSIVDGVRTGLTPVSLRSLIADMQPDLVGFSVVSAAEAPALACMESVRTAAPQSIIIAGGPHPSAMPGPFWDKAFPNVDYILRGEAEIALSALVEDLARFQKGRATVQDLEAIPGMYARIGDQEICCSMAINPTLDFPAMPAWDLMPPASYPRAPHGAFFRRFPVAPVLTSRGCNYGCGFCSVPTLSGGRIRFRKPDLVVRELEVLKTQYGVREIQIIDDNFTARRSHALKICRAMAHAGLDLPWSSPNGVRMENLDDELVEAMADAGCYSVSLGLESGSSRVLERMKKGLTLDNVAATVGRMVRRGLEVNGFFMLGYPGETEKDMNATIRFARSLPLTRANFSLFTPLPGCPEWERAAVHPGGVFRYDAPFSQIGYVPEGLTAKRLKHMQRKAFLRFYARPRAAGRLTASLGSKDALYYFARRAYHWLAKP